MSAFDNYEKGNVYAAITNFLETHKISELIEIVKYCIEDKEYEE